MVKYIGVGSEVEFVFEGQKMKGVVANIKFSYFPPLHEVRVLKKPKGYISYMLPPDQLKPTGRSFKPPTKESQELEKFS